MSVEIGYNAIEELGKYLSTNNIDNIYIITDTNVHRLHMNYIKSIIENHNHNIFIMEAGEDTKNMNTVFAIYDDLLNNQIDRNTLILAFGGGVVGDIAGFVASTYKRGLKYIQIPTTLLAQIDSSIGGKVGVDYSGYKNIIGSFYFPEKVFTDTYFLSTLSKKEITSGLGEILKYGLIYDYDLFQYTRENIDRIYDLDLNILDNIIKSCIRIKQEIVAKDKRDLGIRRILNFGHTIGHSIEAYYNFSKFNHGEAVILGILYETYIARFMGLIDTDYYNEIYNTLISIIKPIKFHRDEIKTLLEIMENDKKNISNRITFVLPIGEGKVEIFSNVDEKLIIDSLEGEWF